MTDSLGLSIGMTNLVAAREGRAPVIRRSILTLHNDRAPEVGEYPGSGLPLAGFVERVGDPVPLVAADGSQHRGERVLAEALDVMARAAGGGAPVTIAVPAHWGPSTVAALQGALRRKRVADEGKTVAVDFTSLAEEEAPAEPEPDEERLPGLRLAGSDG